MSTLDPQLQRIADNTDAAYDKLTTFIANLTAQAELLKQVKSNYYRMSVISPDFPICGDHGPAFITCNNADLQDITSRLEKLDDLKTIMHTLHQVINDASAYEKTL